LRYLLSVVVVVVAMSFFGDAVAMAGPIVCEEDSCAVLPSPPDDPTPGTLVPGPGNPPVHFPSKHGKRAPHHGKKRSHR